MTSRRFSDGEKYITIQPVEYVYLKKIKKYSIYEAIRDLAGRQERDKL